MNSQEMDTEQDDAIDALWKGAQRNFMFLVDFAENYSKNPFDTVAMMEYLIHLSNGIRAQMLKSIQQLLAHEPTTHAPYYLKVAESGLRELENFASVTIAEHQDGPADNSEVPQDAIAQRLMTILREVGENADRACVIEGHSEFAFTGGCARADET